MRFTIVLTDEPDGIVDIAHSAEPNGICDADDEEGMAAFLNGVLCEALDAEFEWLATDDEVYAPPESATVLQLVRPKPESEPDDGGAAA